MKKTLLLTLSLLVASFGFSQFTVDLTPEIDNAIYSESSNSAGLGRMYSGRTCADDDRRAFVQFDIAGMIPAGSIITSVTLEMDVDKIPLGAVPNDFSLHKTTTEWGEGTSVPPGAGGTGAPAIAPDATWTDAMFGTSTWTTPGGDFNPIASATETLPASLGPVTWSSASMVTDVQNWLDAPATNFGWTIIGDETTSCTARRFGSKDLGTAPVLSITYTCTAAPDAVCQNIEVYLDGTGNVSILPEDLDGGSVAVCGGDLTFTATMTDFGCGDVVTGPAPPAMIITSAYDGPLVGGLPKGVEVYVINDIADLSEYGIGWANNGGGTDGVEFTFPAVSASAGDYIYVASESPQFTAWFGFAPDYTDGDAAINGDDAVELFQGGVVIDVFGDIDTDGTGEPWEYMDGWAYRNSGTTPDGSTFNISNWSFSGINALDGETDNATAATPVPVGSFTTPSTAVGTDVTLTVTDEAFNTNTCTATVTVLDTLPPVMTCDPAPSFALDGTGNLTLSPSDIAPGTTDNCGIATETLSQTDFDCSHIGSKTITYYATDVNGNIDSCETTITITGDGIVTITEDLVTDVSCFGDLDGSIEISVSGGSGIYVFDWDNDGTGDTDDPEDLLGLTGGVYMVTAYDSNECFDTMTFTVDSPTEIVVAGTVTDITCFEANDGAIDLTISGGAGGYLFDWDNDGIGDTDDSEDLAGLSAGDYDVTVYDASGCESTMSYTILEGYDIDESIAVAGFTLGSLEAGGTYQWVECPDYTVIAGETSADFTPTVDGDYAVIITSSGCVDTSECVTVVGNSLVDQESNFFSIFPNPTAAEVQLMITSPNDVISVEVIGLNGQVIAVRTDITANMTISLADLDNGVYIVKVNTLEESLTKKITLLK